MFIVASAVCFSTIVIFMTLGRRTQAPLLALLAWRYVIASAVLVVMSGRRVRDMPWRRMLPLFAVGVIGQAGLAFLSLLALDFIPAAMVSFLFFTFPVWVAVITAVRGIAPITPRRALALLASLAGIALLVTGGRSLTINPIGAALALAAAVGYAVYIPVVAHAQEGIDPETASALICLGATVSFCGAALVRGELFAPFTPAVWVYVATLGIVSTALGFVLFLRGLRLLDPVRVSIVATAEPFFTALLGWLVLSQRLTIPMMFGGVLIAGAVIALQSGSERAPA